MLVAGYYGPRYAKLAEFNETANADEKFILAIGLNPIKI